MKSNIKTVYTLKFKVFCVYISWISLFLYLRIASLRFTSTASPVDLYNLCFVLHNSVKRRKCNVNVTSKRQKAFSVGYSTLTVHFLLTRRPAQLARWNNKKRAENYSQQRNISLYHSLCWIALTEWLTSKLFLFCSALSWLRSYTMGWL